MNYDQAIDWLYSQVPNYQNQGIAAYKPGLERMFSFSEKLNLPHTKFKSIHIAGTNGKGSTSHMLASILQEEGYQVGLFTSPHLKNFTERIKLNGKEIDRNSVTQFIEKIQTIPQISDASFFEITTLMAMDYFANNTVDIAIIETGLGGRLDATNIIQPLVSVITTISLDHTALLGNTESAIAKEKGGIIKENTPLVLGKLNKESLDTLLTIAQKKNASVFIAEENSAPYPSDLLGSYQIENQRTVLKTLEILPLYGMKISETSISNGLMKVEKNTGLQGRWQVKQKQPLIIWDTAHNEAGIRMAVEQLENYGWENVHFLIGFVKDKDIATLLNLFPKEARYIFTQPSLFRGLSPNAYEELLRAKFQQYEIIEKVPEAYQKIQEKTKPNEVIWVGGSNFVIADLL